MGRISTFTEETAEAIIDWISAGKTLRGFCRQKDAPNWRTVYQWRDAHPDFDARFARARDVGADAIAEQALEIADTPVAGVRTEESDEFGTKTTTEDMLGHRKLQVETRLKLLAKWNPKKYGDRIHQEVTGKDGGPIQHEDTRAANVAVVDQVSERLASATAGETTGDGEESDPSEPDGGTGT